MSYLSKCPTCHNTFLSDKIYKLSINFAVLIRQDSKIAYSYDGWFEGSEVIVSAQEAFSDRFGTLKGQS